MREYIGGIIGTLLLVLIVTKIWIILASKIGEQLGISNFIVKCLNQLKKHE